MLVSAMHITAAVWVNDDEPGLHQDTLEWLDKVAPPSWKEPANDVARELLPDPGDYRHHRGGEDNGDAHLKNLLVHHQVILPITEGRLDLGPWQAVFYCEFDGRRSKRLVIKVIGRLAHSCAGDAPLRGRAGPGDRRRWSRSSSARRPRPPCSTRSGRRGRCSTGCCSQRSCCSRSGVRRRSRPVAGAVLGGGVRGDPRRR